jgi:threonine dehydrogenase-like Zn-dependent dehydrogenase
MNKTMWAAVFEGEGQLKLKEVPVPRVERPDQVLLQVDAVSICGTDVHIVAVPPGYIATPNTILGHEFCGTVVEKGVEVHHLKIGDRVVVNPNDYCGVCTYCRKNLPNECENIAALGIHVDGAFAQYCRVSAKVAYPISQQVPLAEAACAEPLACVINGTNKVRVQPGETTVVIGAGPIGMIMAMMFKASGAGNVIVAERAPYRLDYARRLGLGRVVDVTRESLKDVVSEETGIGADVVADVTGSQLAAAIDVARKGGRVMVFGVNTQATAQFPQSHVTFKELQVLGTWLANATFPEAVRVLESRVLNIGGLITGTIPLADVHQGLATLARGEAVKIIVQP